MPKIFTQIRSFWDNRVLLRMQNPTFETQFSYLYISVKSAARFGTLPLSHQCTENVTFPSIPGWQIVEMCSEKLYWTNITWSLSLLQLLYCKALQAQRRVVPHPIDCTVNYTSFLYKPLSSSSEMETVQSLLEREEKTWIKKAAKCMVIYLFPCLLRTVPEMFS